MFGIILQFNNNCQAIRQMERPFYSILQQMYIQRGCSKLSANRSKYLYESTY